MAASCAGSDAVSVVLTHVQIGGRALGEVCNAYPERLLRCLVLVSTPATEVSECPNTALYTCVLV